MSKLAIGGGRKTVVLTDPIWPHVGDEEITATVSALLKSRSDINYITSVRGGGAALEFEEKLAGFFGVRHALATNSGFAALHLAMIGIKIEPGDEVIVSPYTWGQTVSPILLQGGIPIFADIDPLTYNLDAASVERCISEHTRAIMLVHIYGHPAEMGSLLDVANKYHLPIVEDCAHAAATTYKGQRVGTFGRVGCFSIGNGKQMIGGEGGFLLTNDSEVYDRGLMMTQISRCLKLKLTNPKLLDQADSLLYSYNIHPLAAVIAFRQLDFVDTWNEERRQNHERLTRGLKGVPGIRPVYVAEGSKHVYHHYSPTFSAETIPGVSREVYVEALAAEGVDIDLGYVRSPIHLWRRVQERSYQGRGYPWCVARRPIAQGRGSCPNAEQRCASTEIDLGPGPAWRGDQTAIVDQYLDAFYKIAENIDFLRRLSSEQHPV